MYNNETVYRRSGSRTTLTRDPFERLLVAHARLRGWRLATSDGPLLAHLLERERLEI